MNEPDSSASQPSEVAQAAHSPARRILWRLCLAFLVFAMAVALCVFVHYHPKLFTTMIGDARTLGFFPLAVVSAWIIIGNRG